MSLFSHFIITSGCLPSVALAKEGWGLGACRSRLIPLPEFHGLRPCIGGGASHHRGGKAPRNPEDSRGKVPEISSHTGQEISGETSPALSGRNKRTYGLCPYGLQYKKVI